MITFENVRKSYGNHEVLKGISFSVKKGERIALIGASGAGKSTLLHLLTTASEIETGSIMIDNKPIDTYVNGKKRAEKIGIMRQQFDLVLPLKVINNVLVGRLREWGFFKSLFSMFFHFDKEKALDALSQVGIRDKAYERTGNLSGGEQQRVAMARLLVQAPDIILADEPIASLDPTRGKAVIDLLLKLSRDHNHTLLVSLHTLEIALNCFDRVIALESGRIVFDGKPADISKEELDKIYALKEARDIG
jgi:phosphonate transport system ATP-binding protein